MTQVRLGRASIGGRPVVLVDLAGVAYRLSDVLQGVPGIGSGSLDELFAAWPQHAGRLDDLAPGAAAPITVAPDAFLPPLERPKHLICIGTNYRDHIAEMGIPANPAFPYAFLKPITTIAPPAGPVTLPAIVKMTDWEAELGVVVGASVRNIGVEDALSAVAGYLPMNDVSARDWIDDRPSLGIDWVMQKAHDGFSPLGPWITLAPGVADPQSIPVRCLVNGVVRQDSSTSNMLFSVAEIIAHLSSFMTLSPGDLIATGTPAGVGFGMKPRLFIADGDVVTVSMGELGEYDTRFVAEQTASSSPSGLDAAVA